MSRSSLSLFLYVIRGCLDNQTLPGVRFTDAGIKCLHCSNIPDEIIVSFDFNISYSLTIITYTALICSATIFALAGGYLCYFKLAHSSTQQSEDTKQDIYLKDVILALSWGSRKGEN